MYRADKQKERNEQLKKKSFLRKLTVKKRNGRLVLFNYKKISDSVLRACPEYNAEALAEDILDETTKSLYDGITTEEIDASLVLAASSLLENDPEYNYVAARLFLQKLRREVFGQSTHVEDLKLHYKEAFVASIELGVQHGLLDKRMLDYDLDCLTEKIVVDRDDLLPYISIQTLYERYLLKTRDRRLELPQTFWMRVAMGLAIGEGKDQEDKAIEFYETLSSLRFVSSTPTLFHAGTVCPQLSSCYLTTVNDDLSHIFKCIGDNAQLSKWSGGLGNDWSNVRGTGSWIKSTKVESQGVIPFLKIADSATVAIKRSGKRRGATCAYLETWHYDIEEFLDLRKNTGDERRRTHDMNTANWIPDLFIKRVKSNENWTLFSPDETPDLHSLYGKAFDKRYVEYENKAKRGKIKLYKTLPATKLWRKMLTMLFETGHPWITFKDPCNIRSPQDHIGVVHSSNLCTEITLNTSETETAVCNIGSVNLATHFTGKKLDKKLLERTVRTAIRMLDNVIDENFYPTKEARESNMRHRPIGLGMMGFQDALFKRGLAFDSVEAVQLSDEIMEIVSYHAILTSSKLAREKGSYESYKGSKWDRGIFPLDTLTLLQEERGEPVLANKDSKMNWDTVKSHVAKHGMRNSNTMAIAPTATISNIAGCFPCIEPIYKNIYVKANITGEFTIINHYLVDELKKLGIWDREMLDDIKYHDGNLQKIKRIPNYAKKIYKEAFEIDPIWVIKHAAARAKWLDQSQSVNIFIKGVSGKKLHETYISAWEWGLKTTYYLRTLAASQIEKSTLDANRYGFTQKRDNDERNRLSNNGFSQPTNSKLHKAKDESVDVEGNLTHTNGRSSGTVELCRIEDPECEACQ